MIYRSPFPAVEIPEVSLTEFVFRDAHLRADKPALIDGRDGRTLTYAQLVEAIRRAASGLARRGFRQRDVLAIYSPNAPEYPVAFHAAAMLGGVVTTINPLYTAEEVSSQLRDAGAKFSDRPAAHARAREAAEVTGPNSFRFGEARADGRSLFVEEPPANCRPCKSIRARIGRALRIRRTTGVANGVM